jgi:hypothetical protein
MRADVLDLLRDADPAAAMPAEDEAAREALRAAAISSPAMSWERPRGGRHRRLILVAAVLVGALLAFGGWTLYAGLVTGPESALDEFHVAQSQIDVPAGAHWREPSFPDALYGRYAGLNAALSQATCGWFEEWDAAASTGADGRVAAAESAVASLRARMPVHREGEPEEAGGSDPASLAAFDRIVQDAKAGDRRGVEQYVRANC